MKPNKTQKQQHKKRTQTQKPTRQIVDGIEYDVYTVDINPPKPKETEPPLSFSGGW